MNHQNTLWEYPDGATNSPVDTQEDFPKKDLLIPFFLGTEDE